MLIRRMTFVVIALISVFFFQGCAPQSDIEASTLRDQHIFGQSTLLSTKKKNKEMVLFRSDTKKKIFYRIPSIVTFNKSKFVVAFAEQRVGSNEDSGDINVVYRVSYNHGKSWGKILKACDLGKNTCGNPTAVVDQKSQKLHLFMNSNPGDRDQFGKNGKKRFRAGDRKVRYRQASFKGKTLQFKPLKDLTSVLQPKGTKFDAVGPGVGIQLSRGRYKNRLLIPVTRRTFISDNGGSSWRMSKSIMPNLSSEASLVELDNGHIFRNDRATGKYKMTPRRRVLSFSKDGGDVFSYPSKKNKLYDPISQGSMFRYSKGNIFFANCASTVSRRYMNIRMTKDGKKWTGARRIDPACGYSSMTKTRDFKLAILYERRSKSRGKGKVPQDLIFKKFPLSYFKSK